MDYQAEFQRWLENVTDATLLSELHAMTEAQREDAFYRELAFGTGGLRGVIGAGTNRMNVYVVAKASQGLANYLLQSGETRAVVIGYDSRINSALFAQTAASVFAANGIAVHFWRELTPVPTVSYAIRRLKTSYGVMITASHNPAQYNGYKVYGCDGCQVTTDAAAAILAQIQRLDIFRDIAAVRFDDALASGGIQTIQPQVLDGFMEEVKRQSVLFGDAVNKNVSLVYTPLNGTGLQPVTRVLRETGFTNITVVEEQRCPDGNFPTCPSPNPEVREAMALGLTYCSRCSADLLLATDPDCDRCGIAVREQNGAYRLLSANETGLLLLDFICAQRTRHGKMPPHPVFIKTIVTTDLAETVARHYGVRTVNVLTGFKYVCEQVGRLQNQDDYIFGFEESYGYLAGAYVRDKDGVNAAFLISEMFAYYKTRGISLTEKLEELYKAFGYCLNTQHTYTFDGSAGIAKMRAIMQIFRSGVSSLAGDAVQKAIDYSRGIDGLPPSDVVKLHTASCSAVIRPSGTEPKLKVYINVTAKNEASARVTEAAVSADIETIIRAADKKTE